MSVLEVKNLNKSFKKHFFSKSVPVLKDVSFSLKKGMVTGLLGLNGSGKSTCFKSIFNLVKKDFGEIFVFGKKWEQDISVRNRVGFMPERVYFSSFFTSEQILNFLNSFHAKNIQTQHLLDSLDLLKTKETQEFSKGMLQKLNFLQSIAHQPDLLVLDEPFSGLDFLTCQKLISIIDNLKAQGVCIFLSSHLLSYLAAVCDDILILDQGHLKYSGSLKNFFQQIKMPEGGSPKDFYLDIEKLENGFLQFLKLKSS